MWKITAPHGLHQEQSARTRFLYQDAGILRAGGHGLFDQDMLARAKREQAMFKMFAVWGRNVDDVDVRMTDKRLVAVVSVFHLPGIGERLSTLALREATANGHWRVLRRKASTNADAILAGPSTPQRKAGSPWPGKNTSGVGNIVGSRMVCSASVMLRCLAEC
ncbi:hypothetical protein GW15_0219680 [Xanthomonas axonopodis pv. vasculorum]|uniref:Uncharacterized protein n=1 Tax=Xanthomonas axonopodis pv. vasculorum TaxID=325777 RepID=A0A098PVM8_9XANT|nr:hypothetical protein GW15_0219680 [Xanthomonas axonopodis pv. vasculorum]